MEIKALQIDLARQKENLPFIFSYMDFAKKCGYNTLVLYLEHAVRTTRTDFFDVDETYSKEEISKIVEYATDIGLDVIPALETLGHLEKFFKYEQLIPLAEKDEYEMGRKLYGHKYTCGCVSNPEFISFMDDYVKEIVSLFPGKYVHVGLDETFNFAVCKECQKRIKEGEDAKELFYQFVMHIHGVVKSLGKTMMMWDDFFEYFNVVEKLPRDIVMCNWNYMFVSDEPAGHWTNRIKKDWFSLYDKLGFEYIFCTYSHRASSTYAIDSFTDYAERYSPKGALMTAWERSDSFYHGSYPCVLYSAKRWSGLAKKEDKAKIYGEYLKNQEVADLIASLNVIDTSGFRDISKITECDYQCKWAYRDTLKYALPKLKKAYEEAEEGEIKDVLIDIYDYVLEQYLGATMQRTGVDYFNGVEKSKIIEKIDFVKDGLKEIKSNGDNLWGKYRVGIKSTNDNFENKFKRKQESLDNIKEGINSSDKFGILCLDLMLPESYSTVRGIVEVEYEDGEKTELYRGAIKSSAVLFDVGGCYHYRLKIKPKKLSKLIFSVFGEGAMYPTHFRYSVDGNAYEASSVKKISGHAENLEKILRDDTRFAEMGYDDGVAHANNINLCKEISAIEVTFAPIK